MNNLIYYYGQQQDFYEELEITVLSLSRKANRKVKVKQHTTFYRK